MVLAHEGVGIPNPATLSPLGLSEKYYEDQVEANIPSDPRIVDDRPDHSGQRIGRRSDP